MPKESVAGFIARMIAEYPGVFRSDNSVLFCTFCNCQVSASKIFQVKQHFSSAKHQAAENRKKPDQSTQTLMTEYQQPNINRFHFDLCKSFLEANIPLKKVSNPSIIRLFETYTKNAMPSETNLRHKYVPMLYDKCIEDLRAKAKGKYIWVSLDETTDAKQQMVVNFLFGIMESDETHPERGKSYLLNMAIVDAANANNMAKFFNDSLLLLWPEGKCFNDIQFIIIIYFCEDY